MIYNSTIYLFFFFFIATNYSPTSRPWTSHFFSWTWYSLSVLVISQSCKLIEVVAVCRMLMTVSQYLVFKKGQNDHFIVLQITMNRRTLCIVKLFKLSIVWQFSMILDLQLCFCLIVSDTAGTTRATGNKSVTLKIKIVRFFFVLRCIYTSQAAKNIWMGMG